MSITSIRLLLSSPPAYFRRGRSRHRLTIDASLESEQVIVRLQARNASIHSTLQEIGTWNIVNALDGLTAYRLVLRAHAINTGTLMHATGSCPEQALAELALCRIA